MRQFISVSFQITLAFLLVKSVHSENLKNEIFIESDSMHIDELKSISTFSGNVILKYGELSLSSDKIIITRKNNNISLIQAFGTPASFNLEDNKLPENNKITGNSEEILFNSEDQTILLIGNANIESIDNIITAHSVLFNLSTRSINLKGDSNSSSERVRVKINK